MAPEHDSVVQFLEDLIRDRLSGWPAQWEGYHWPGYTYEHTLRVRALALELAAREGADPEVVELACLLHDIRKDSGKGHAKIGAEEAEVILKGLGVKPKLCKRVCQAIALHSGDNKPDSPAESLCLGDADLIDSNFGLVATWRFITIRSGHDAALDETIAGMSSWLPKKDELLDWLLTRSGREIARQRSARMRVFCEQLMEEMTRPPEQRDGVIRAAGHFHNSRGEALLADQVTALEALCGEMSDQMLAVICRSLRREITGQH
jgi:uncharacterized protein